LTNHANDPGVPFSVVNPLSDMGDECEAEEDGKGVCWAQGWTEVPQSVGVGECC